MPKSAAPGKPWVFTGDAIERDATVEQALLAKGYHILIVSPLGSGFTQKQWDDAYKLLVDNGFSNKPVLKGTGAKAGEAYAWAVANPDKVSCLYARNPLIKSLMAGKRQPIDDLAGLAKAGVPVLHDCGELDPWLDTQTRVVEKRYRRTRRKDHGNRQGRRRDISRSRRKTRSRSWILSSRMPIDICRMWSKWKPSSGKRSNDRHRP